MCNKQNERIGRDLMTSSLKPIQSCLDCNDYVHLKRAILEIIASNMANTREDLESFVNHTLYCQKEQISFEYLKTTSGEEFNNIVRQNSAKKFNDIYNKEDETDPIKSSINFLLEYEFIRLHQSDDGEDINFVPTKLGLACLSSSLAPKEGFMLFQELIKARQNFVLECDLHAIYLVTPYSITHQLDSNFDWRHFEDLYDKLPAMMKRVGEMVGVSVKFLIKAIRGRNIDGDHHLLAIHKRFVIYMTFLFYKIFLVTDFTSHSPCKTSSMKFQYLRFRLNSISKERLFNHFNKVLRHLRAL